MSRDKAVSLECGGKTPLFSRRDTSRQTQSGDTSPHSKQGADDNPTVGIILCTEKDHTVVKYSVLNENQQLFASKYMLYLPTEEALREELERERALVVRERQANYGEMVVQ